MAADDYTTPPRTVGRDAVFVRHRHKSPQVADSAYIAPTAVLCGDVTVGPHSRVLFGAVITAEGGPVEIGAHCVVMENAVVRGVPQHPTRLGDHVVVGPHASLTGCVIEGDTRIVLFVRLADGVALDDDLETRIRDVLRTNCSPRHVPARILPVADIPRTRSGKIVELAVRNIVHDRPVKNREALANPEALELYKDLPELKT